MRIDRTHRPWLIGSCLFLGLLLLIYIPYALFSSKVGGGTPLGILYGVIGFGFMLFAAALGIRKRFPIWRIGRAQHWMRGHSGSTRWRCPSSSSTAHSISEAG